MENLSTGFTGYTNFNEVHLDILAQDIVPQHIRMNYPNFYTFIRIYLEKLSTRGEGLEVIHNLLAYANIDETSQFFVERFCENYLKELTYLPEVNKRILVKWIRQWYEATGSEQSFRFLFRVLYNEDIDFYYPSQDMLRISDGKWCKETMIRVKRAPEHPVELYQDMVGTEITGSISGSKALVEKVVVHTELVDTDEDATTPKERIDLVDLYISAYSRDFPLASFLPNDNIKQRHLNDDITWEDPIFYIVASVYVEEGTNQGNYYRIGDTVHIKHPIGSQCVAMVETITSGEFTSVYINSPGKGYALYDTVNFEDGHGYGAYAYVTKVGPHGEILTIRLGSGGSNYTAKPKPVWKTENGTGAVVDVVPKNVGAIRSVKIVNPGFNYRPVEWEDINHCFTLPLTMVGCFNLPRNDLEALGKKKGLTLQNYDGSHSYNGKTFTPYFRRDYKDGTEPDYHILPSKKYTELSQQDKSLVDSSKEARKCYSFPIVFDKVAVQQGGKGDTIVTYKKIDSSPLLQRNDNIYAVDVQNSLFKGRVVRIDNSTNVIAIETSISNYADSFPEGTELFTIDQNGIKISTGNIVTGCYTSRLNLETGAICEIPAYYSSMNGWLDAPNKIQDSYFYQVFSYVIKTKIPKEKWIHDVEASVHPSGLICFDMMERESKYGSFVGRVRPRTDKNIASKVMFYKVNT